jgi:hypothetical protein
MTDILHAKAGIQYHSIIFDSKEEAIEAGYRKNGQ